MGYDSYYRRDGLEEIPEGANDKKKITSVSLYEPLLFWIGLLAIAAVLQLAAIPIAVKYNHTALDSYFNMFAGFVIYIPGIVILPLIASLWIGDRVSYLDEKKSFVAYKGVLNGIYVSIFYSVSMFIVYFIMRQLNSGVLAAFSILTFAEYLIAVPVAITIVIVPIFAVISAARRYG